MGDGMNIETVNELIQSLESAGELSIKESKYLELAKAYQQLAAENVVRQEFIKICFRAAADGASLDSSDIQEIGECLGLFGRETYQPMLHGYICGHEAGEDSVYVMKSAPATDAYLAGIKADGVEEFVSNTVHKIFDESDAVSALAYLSLANSHVKQLREVADK
ncbi:TPA: hypothetical protein L9S99_002639 [Klebsiella pneumoniae]|nr:hypothetical protein [Klebsiella pneumoniae]